jgi:hypothetical protein
MDPADATQSHVEASTSFLIADPPAKSSKRQLPPDRRVIRGLDSPNGTSKVDSPFAAPQDGLSLDENLLPLLRSVGEMSDGASSSEC